ncbi:Tim44 domain-containing protein [Piscinibacter koreensis]|uniref:Tim44 domain-containing protein n=1 Tax=Piscinibacter koreensis TaxID=2742824 RepID=A0A7Y6NQ40_9BURK|nr:Tim44-like domain-containing protein [Schlegelella koreensis]NUZ07162.1 Tim44 domain-containing protein [Schlegelella koreensis]
MKSLIMVLTLAVAAAGFAPVDAEARRLGGGGFSGMQRSLPARPAPSTLPARPATTPAATPAAVPGAAAAAAAPRRSWLGPIAGLAAGLGIAALMSHLGLGAAFGNILTMLLLAAAAFFVIRFLLRRFGPAANRDTATANGMRLAGAGAPADAADLRSNRNAFEPAPAAAAAGLGPTAAATDVSNVPADFDRAAFERVAKMIFIRMQAANDRADLNDLRNFTTPEMFAAVRLDLQERGPAAQQTDVVKIDAEVLDVAQEATQQVVSVRFHGLIREELDGAAAPFDEVWHLVKPTDGSREWAIAGIQQTQAA